MESVVFYPELLDKILSFLPLRDLLIASQVSPTFKKAANRSLKRRMILQFARAPQGKNYRLLMRDVESYTPLQQLQQLQPQPPESQEFDWLPPVQDADLSTLDLNIDSNLEIGLYETRDLSPIAIQLMKPDWCFSIRHLALTHHLAVEDWNAIGTFVLSKFPALILLHLRLLWVPDYKSTLTVSHQPEEQLNNTICCNVETIIIQLLDQGFVHDDKAPSRTPLQGKFLAVCPNLKGFRLEYNDRREKLYDFEEIFVNRNRVRFHKYKHQLQVCYSSEEQDLIFNNYWCNEPLTTDGAPVTPHHADSVCSALAPMLSSLPVSHLHIDESPRSLQYVSEDVASKVKSIEITLDFDKSRIISDMGFLVDFIKDHSFTSVESLELNLNLCDFPPFYLDLRELRISDAYNQLKLPQIRRLVVIGEDWELLYILARPVHACVEAVFPNVELLIVCVKFGVIADIVIERFCYSGLVLKETAKLQRLRHLVWELDYFQASRRSIRYRIPKFLARHRALQSLSIFVHGADDLKVVKAIVRGCAAAPRMRLLQVFVDGDMLDLLENDKKLQALVSNFESLTVKFFHEDDFDRDDFQLAPLDQLCRELGGKSDV